MIQDDHHHTIQDDLQVALHVQSSQNEICGLYSVYWFGTFPIAATGPLRSIPMCYSRHVDGLVHLELDHGSLAVFLLAARLDDHFYIWLLLILLLPSTIDVDCLFIVDS